MQKSTLYYKYLFYFTICYNILIKLVFQITLSYLNFCFLQVNFDSYKAIVSFVNIQNVHWQFLVSSEYICII